MTTNTEQIKPQWLVQVFGEKCSHSWEISVVRCDNIHGQRSWGWFGEDKLLVSHNGGPSHTPLCEFVWDRQMQIAYDLCAELNRRAPTREHHDN